MIAYRTIVADPPWAYRNQPETGKRDRRAAAAAFYPTMTRDTIASIDIGGLAADDAHLYLWVTNPLLFDKPTIPEMFDGWGFAYKTLLTWNKTGPTGLGAWFRGRTEHVAFGVRGSAPIEHREQNIFAAPNGEHSAKPDCFYDMVERVSPAPWAELFARRARFGWDYPIGDQALGGVAA